MPYFGEEAKGHKSMFSAIDQFSMEAAPDAESRLRMENFSAPVWMKMGLQQEVDGDER